MLEHLRLREGWLSLILLFLVVLTVAWSFQAGGLTEGLQVLPNVAILGVVVGFVAAKSRLPGLLAHPLGLAVGIICCFLLLSSLILLPPELRAPGLLGWLADLQLRGTVMAQRLQTWLTAALSNEASTDPFPFVAQMAAVCWLLAFYGAWFQFRAHWVWGVVLPSGVTIFLSVYYAPPRLMAYFVAYLFLALTLVVRSNVYARERDWQQHHVVYDQYIGLEFLRDGVLLSLAVMAVIWFIPRPNAPQRLGDYLQRLQGPFARVQQEWSRLYASLGYREQTGLRSFGRTMTLGGAVNLSSTPVLEVQTEEPHYWRAVVLDRYTGSGWADTSGTTLKLAAGVPLNDWSVYAARKVLLQTVTLRENSDLLLFAAGEPLQAQVPIRALGTVPQPGTEQLAGSVFDLSMIYAQRLGSDSRYQVVSLVSTASIRDLRGAGTDYPEWVTRRYLQVPPSVPARMRELAQQVVGNQATPYDKAVAIESYLRGFSYNQAIEAPPRGQDPVYWFLFRSKEGYCTYFASAMTLMCRAVGIPARIAQGYAPGEYDVGRLAFVARESDAHAWPELYFPGYGWIEFEPTPSQPTIFRRTGDEEPETGGDNASQPPGRDIDPNLGRDMPIPLEEDPLDIPYSPPQRQTGRAFTVRLAAILAAGGLLTGGVWYVRRRWHALRPAERLYLRLQWLAGAAGVSARPGQTPLEFGRSLAATLGHSGEWASQIVRVYVSDRFGRRRATREELEAAGEAWRRLRPLVALQPLRGLIRRLRGRSPGA